MFCPKCGEKNVEGAKFCAKCGANFEEVVGVPTKSTKKAVTVKKTVANSDNVVGDIFKHMISAFIKPFESFKKSEKNYLLLNIV